MELLDLPSEILSEIINLCGPRAITETCRTFADIAASTSALWTSVHLGPLQVVPEGREHLRRRLSRTADSLLTVSIRRVQDEGTALLDLLPGGIIGDLCLILSDWSTKISHLQVNSETTVGARFIICTIFPGLISSVIFPALQSLSVRVETETDYDFYYDNLKPDLLLYSILEGSYKTFPCIQFLSIPSFDDSIPSFPENATFSHLHTLVLDGAHEKTSTNICRVMELLSNTPQLETLWLKHDLRTPDEAALNPVPSWEQYKGHRPLRVFLPRLVRLAVAVPGTGTDLLYCLEAPSIEDLHIDGSRPRLIPRCLGDGVSIRGALRSFASRSLGLRRLAFTKTHVFRRGYGWFLFGDEGRPLFPELETLAFHAEPFWEHLILQSNRSSQQRTMPLRRFVMLRCRALCFRESALIELYQRFIANAPNKKYELEIDHDQITDKDSDILEALGVKLTRRHHDGEAKMDEWGTLGYKVDASDSLAY